MAFKCEPFQERDENGKIEEYGVRWTEGDKEVGSAILSTITSIAIFIAGLMLSNSYGNIWFFIIISIPSGAFAALLIWTMGKRQEELTFTTDDLAKIGNGKHYTDFRPSNIVSIEFRRDEQPIDKNAEPIRYPRCTVIFLNDDGEIAKIARRLHEDDALRLTTQLNKALAAITQSMRQDSIQAAPTNAPQIAAGERHVPRNRDDIDPLA